MLRKNQKQVFTRVLIMATIAALAVTALWVGNVRAIGPSGAPRVSPPNSTAFGKALAEWLTIYWRWGFTGGESKVGPVQLMPLPAGEWSGTGTEEDPYICVGRLDITLEAGTPFVLPLFAWLAERYQDGSEDPMVPDDEFIEDCVHPLLTIDGRTVVSDANKKRFYVPPTRFDPPIVYPAPSPYGSVAVVCHQTVGIVSPPLPVGKHIIHLYETYHIPLYTTYSPPYWGMYDNTWVVTVAPKRGR